MEKHILFLIVLVSSSLSMAQNQFHHNYENTLCRLDSLVQHNEVYVKEKKNKIQQLKSASHTGTKEEIYWRNKNIYYEYKTFNSDSALVWLDKLEDYAIANNLEKEIVRNKIERAYIFSATGLLVESLKLLDNITLSELPTELAAFYYSEMSYLYSHLHQYAMSNNQEVQPGMRNYYQIQQLTYIDSLQRTITSDNEDYLWYMAWKYRETDSLQCYRAKLEDELTGKSFSKRREAMLSYALAHLYKEEKDDLGHINALAYSAMADIRCANREIASLQELAYLLFQKGDIDRAYNYISLCLKNAQIYKARIRAVEIANLMDFIYKMNIERNAQREKKLQTNFIALLIIIALVCLTILIIAFQFKRLRSSHAALSRSNGLLNSNISQLTKAQEELREANLKLKYLNGEMLESNRVKEEYIGHVFNMCSNYLLKMDQNQRLMRREFSDMKKDDFLVKNSVFLMEKELKEFYHNFDAIFLNLYPDFIEEFNKLLRPEEHIVLKANELLNTELRIHALVRLGINDSTKIAEFLRISVQTVYNNRLRIRNKAIVSKEEFAIKLKKLGNINLS